MATAPNDPCQTASVHPAAMRDAGVVCTQGWTPKQFVEGVGTKKRCVLVAVAGAFMCSRAAMASRDRCSWLICAWSEAIASTVVIGSNRLYEKAR